MFLWTLSPWLSRTTLPFLGVHLTRHFRGLSHQSVLVMRTLHRGLQVDASLDNSDGVPLREGPREVPLLGSPREVASRETVALFPGRGEGPRRLHELPAYGPAVWQISGPRRHLSQADLVRVRCGPKGAVKGQDGHHRGRWPFECLNCWVCQANEERTSRRVPDTRANDCL
jgi:hypothetical protein